MPIAGASVYVYAAGNSAQAGTYGTGATSLLNSAVLTPVSGVVRGGQDANGNYYTTTDSGGNFSITGDYVCPAAVVSGGTSYNSEVYVLVLGGNAGGGVNAVSALVAALGPCAAGGDLSATIPYVTVNEVSTVAAVWALQQFMGPPTGVAGSFQIGAPVTNLMGLQNAFAMVPRLVTLATGYSGVAIGTAAPEYAKIYTIANVLASCVNSNNTSSLCSNLFASVTPPGTMLSAGGVAASTLNAPADTVQAAWMMAQFPANIGGTGTCGATGAAYQCVVAQGPFPNALSAEPNDWTLAVGFAPKNGSTAVVGGPFGVAIDGFGNAWLTNTTSSAPANSVVELSPVGEMIMAPVTAYTAAANSGYASVLNTQYGVTQSAGTRTIASPRGIAIDSNNNAWVADYKSTAVTITGGTYSCPGGDTCVYGSVAKFPASTGAGVGSTGTASGYWTGTLPFNVTADANGAVYFVLAGGSTNPGSKLVAKIDSAGNYTAGAGVGSNPYGIAIDNNTTVSGGPILWVSAQKTCLLANGYVGAITQMLTGSLANTASSSLAGYSTNGCTGTIRDTFTANTGVITGMAADALNNMWLVNSSTLLGATTAGTGANHSVTYVVPLQSTGEVPTGAAASVTTAIPASGAGAGGLNNPQYVAVDGAGNAWVSNYGSNAVSAFSVSGVGTSGMTINALSGVNGFVHAQTGSTLTNSEGIAIDQAGNVWVASNASTVHYVTVLVGAAAPTGPPIPGKAGVTPSGSLPTITSFTASPATISYGGSATLNWSTDNATSITLTGVSGTPVSPVTVTPGTTAYYTLTATNAAGSVTATVGVVMNAVGTVPGTTVSGMPRAQFFDSGVTNQSVYAGRVYYVWGASGLTQPSPAVPSKYVPYARDPNHSNVSGHSLAWYQANHPDWVVYQCDSNGNPLLPASSIYSTAYGYLYGSGASTTISMPLDITNPAVRTYYFNTFVLPWLQQGWPMIALDNVALTNWDGRCGVYNSSGTWVQQYSGTAADSAYSAAVLSWIQWLTEQVHAYGAGVVGNVTFPSGNNALLPLAAELVNTLDMWIDETGFTGHQDANVNDAAWATKFNFVRQNSSRYYAPMNKTTTGTSMIVPTPSGYTAASQTQIDWSVANYLLYREAHTLLSVTGVDDTHYFVDAAALNVNLGSPVSAPVQDVSGAWARTYTGGLVVVNPSSTVTAVVALPSGTWTDTHGATYTGTISMAPNSGVMLTN